MRILIDDAGAERLKYTQTEWDSRTDETAHYFATPDIRALVAVNEAIKGVRIIGNDALRKLTGKVVEAEAREIARAPYVALKPYREMPHRVLTIRALVKPRKDAKRGSVPRYEMTLGEWLFQTPDGDFERSEK